MGDDKDKEILGAFDEAQNNDVEYEQASHNVDEYIEGSTYSDIERLSKLLSQITSVGESEVQTFCDQYLHGHDFGSIGNTPQAVAAFICDVVFFDEKLQGVAVPEDDLAEKILHECVDYLNTIETDESVDTDGFSAEEQDLDFSMPDELQADEPKDDESLKDKLFTIGLYGGVGALIVIVLVIFFRPFLFPPKSTTVAASSISNQLQPQSSQVGQNGVVANTQLPEQRSVDQYQTSEQPVQNLSIPALGAGAANQPGSISQANTGSQVSRQIDLVNNDEFKSLVSEVAGALTDINERLAENEDNINSLSNNISTMQLAVANIQANESSRPEYNELVSRINELEQSVDRKLQTISEARAPAPMASNSQTSSVNILNGRAVATLEYCITGAVQGLAIFKSRREGRPVPIEVGDSLINYGQVIEIRDDYTVITSYRGRQYVVKRQNPCQY